MTFPPQVPSLLVLSGPEDDVEAGPAADEGTPAGKVGAPVVAVPTLQYTAPPTRMSQLLTRGLDLRNWVTEMPANSAREAQVSPILAVTVSRHDSVP